jgi:hypothetical protein
MFDTTYGKPQKPTLGGFIDWLEKQPAKDKYNYCASDVCACAQYYQSIRLDFAREYNVGDRMAGWLNQVADGGGFPRDWTFGRLLKRAKKLMPV